MLAESIRTAKDDSEGDDSSKTIDPRHFVNWPRTRPMAKRRTEKWMDEWTVSKTHVLDILSSMDNRSLACMRFRPQVCSGIPEPLSDNVLFHTRF
jgi:hypothetical protein